MSHAKGVEHMLKGMDNYFAWMQLCDEAWRIVHYTRWQNRVGGCMQDVLSTRHSAWTTTLHR